MENLALIKARESYGISKEVMAAALNYYDIRTYEHHELDESSRPTPLNMAKIAAILEIEIDSIFPEVIE